jgi:hypothetical protein
VRRAFGVDNRNPHLAPRNDTDTSERRHDPDPHRKRSPTAGARSTRHHKTVIRFRFVGSNEPSLPPSNGRRVTPRLGARNIVKQVCRKFFIDFRLALPERHNIWLGAGARVVLSRRCAKDSSDDRAKCKTPRWMRGVSAKSVEES